MTLAASIPPFTDTERRLHKAVARGWRQDLKTTVEQTLMRGLITALPFVRPGLPRSASGRR
jgi:hypothetical protein